MTIQVSPVYVHPYLEPLEDRLCLNGHPLLAEPHFGNVPAKHGPREPRRTDRPNSDTHHNQAHQLEAPRGAQQGSELVPRGNVPRAFVPSTLQVTPNAISSSSTNETQPSANVPTTSPGPTPAPMPLEAMIALDRALSETVPPKSTSHDPDVAGEAKEHPNSSHIEPQPRPQQQFFTFISLPPRVESGNSESPEETPENHKKTTPVQPTQEQRNSKPKSAPSERLEAPLKALASDPLVQLLDLEPHQIRENVRQFIAHFIDLGVFGCGDEESVWWDVCLATTTIVGGVSLSWLLYRHRRTQANPEDIVWSNEPAPWEVV